MRVDPGSTPRKRNGRVCLRSRDHRLLPRTQLRLAARELAHLPPGTAPTPAAAPAAHCLSVALHLPTHGCLRLPPAGILTFTPRTEPIKAVRACRSEPQGSAVQTVLCPGSPPSLVESHPKCNSFEHDADDLTAARGQGRGGLCRVKLSARPRLLAAEGSPGPGLVPGRLGHSCPCPRGPLAGQTPQHPRGLDVRRRPSLSSRRGRQVSTPRRTPRAEFGSVSHTEGRRRVCGCPAVPTTSHHGEKVNACP